MVILLQLMPFGIVYIDSTIPCKLDPLVQTVNSELYPNHLKYVVRYIRDLDYAVVWRTSPPPATN